MTFNLLTAVLLGIAGFALGLRQIFLDPRNETFPCAPPAVRIAMFIGAAALGYLATLFYGQSRVPFAGQAAAPVAVLAGLLALYFSAMAVNVVGQRLPAATWKRLDRYTKTVRRADRQRAPLNIPAAWRGGRWKGT